MMLISAAGKLRGKLVDRVFEVARQLQALVAQSLDSGLGEQLERRFHRGHAEDRHVTELPALGAHHRLEPGLHPEAGFLVVSPPAAEAWQVEAAAVALVHEDRAGVAGPEFRYL